MKSLRRNLDAQLPGPILDAFFRHTQDHSPISGAKSAKIAMRAMESGDPLHTVEHKRWSLRCHRLFEANQLIRDAGLSVLTVDRDQGGWTVEAANDDTVIELTCRGASQMCFRTKRARRGYHKRISHLQSFGEDIRNPADKGLVSISLSALSLYEDPVCVAKLVSFYDRNNVKPADRARGSVFMLANGPDGLTMSPLGKITEVLERGNYADAVLDAFDHVLLDISDPNPCGRLVVIHGPPGSGKTYLVRGLVQAAKGVRFVMVPASIVPSITGPGLADLFARQSVPTVLVIEDADMLLARRMTDNMNSICGMLNIADGIFGALADVRIVCTTNVEKLDFDPAILRSGRLCRKIEIPALDRPKALDVFRRITFSKGDIDLPGTKISLADVYRAARVDRKVGA